MALVTICENVSVASGKKKQPTPRDMMITLAVILVPVIIISVVFTRDLDDHPVEVVDWKPLAQQAATEASYDILAPTNLPASWRPVRVSWEPEGQGEENGNPSTRNAWQLGFLNPADRYVAIQQADGDRESFVQQVTRDGRADGQQPEVKVGGQTWERYESEDGRTRSLVRSAGESTNIVVGDVEYQTLQDFAATLSVV